MYKVLVAKHEWKGMLTGTRYKLAHYIKWRVRDGVESDLAQDMGLVNSIIDLRVSQNTGYIFAGQLDTRVLKRTLLCGVTNRWWQLQGTVTH